MKTWFRQITFFLLGKSHGVGSWLWETENTTPRVVALWKGRLSLQNCLQSICSWNVWQWKVFQELCCLRDAAHMTHDALSRNKKNNVSPHPCKPKVCHIKVGFKGVKVILVCFRDVFSYTCFCCPHMVSGHFLVLSIKKKNRLLTCC